jgi:tight adherence protein B
MKSPVLKLAVALVAVLGIVPSAGASGGVSLVEAGNTAFPHRAFILTLPRRESITTSDLRVTENGQPVAHLAVTPTGAAGSAVGTVLLVDASNSMAGRPIASAMAAARTFVGRRNVGQEVALITFNRSSNIALPFTSDRTEINSALAKTPALSEGTHIYDAVDEAVGLIDRAGLRAGTIILLSDGADVGSDKRFADVRKELAAHHVRLFSVGLKSGAFDPSTLQRLSGAGNGSFSVAASTDALARIYDHLGFKLANEYLLDYVSPAPPNETVHVRATVAGAGEAAAGYRTPPLQIDAKPPVKPSVVDKVLQSSVTMVVVAALVALLIFAMFRMAFGGTNSSVRQRLGEFVSVTREDERQRQEEVKAALRRETGGMQQFAVYRRFAEDASLADVKTSPPRLVIYGLAAGLLAAAVGAALIGGLGLLAGIVPLLLIRANVSRRLKRKRRLFGEQLADNLEVLSSALRAGHSLVGALAVVVDDAHEPSKTEFQRVLADEQLGVPLENALGMTVKRMASRDLDQVAVVAVLQRDAGANSAEVLDRIVENIRSRQEIRRLVRVLTAQGRMARWIVSLLPLALLLIISLINPSYMQPMWHETLGHIALVVCAILITVGSLIIGKIVDIDV